MVGLDVAGRPPLARERRVSVHGPTVSASRTTSSPLRVIHVVSTTMLARRYRWPAGTSTDAGPTRRPAPRSSSAPKTDGESRSGRQSHSTLPPGATSPAASPSERKARSPIGGNWPATSGAVASRGSRSPPARAIGHGDDACGGAGWSGPRRGHRATASEVATRSSTAGGWRSARTTCMTALISARCVNACGKFPRCLPSPDRSPRRRAAGAPHREQLLAELARALELTDLDQRGHEPERADGERSLLTGQAVVRFVSPIAQHEPVDGELLRDRIRRPYAGSVGGRNRTSGSNRREASSAVVS